MLFQESMSIVQVSEFTKKVLQQIRSIPRGKVATYKQIAELSGKPQASRGVSWILHSCSTKYRLPWHRVLNSKGKISFDKKSTHYKQQKNLLAAEGILFAPNGQLNLAKHQWKKRASKVRIKVGQPKMFR